MIKLNDQQLAQKKDFVSEYMKAFNPADGSKLDANANVTQKNLVTLGGELHKGDNIQLNRSMMYDRITSLFGVELADEYIRQIESHEIYIHDETSLLPYCVSINMFPFLQDGMSKLGGESKAPKHLYTYVGQFQNLMFAVASQFAGAVASVEWLMYFDYFARKDFGDNYLETNYDRIIEHFESTVYTLNQPAAARSYQSIFWNMSLFDREYFNGMFGDFVFPDFTKPDYDSLAKLQEVFMDFLYEERKRAVLTFPVVTASYINDNKKPVDKDFGDNVAKWMSRGDRFFQYTSNTPDSLSSCCRLRNEVKDKPDFSFTLGAGGVATGSINVITVNANRWEQLGISYEENIPKIHKYLVAYRSIIEDFIGAKMLPVYDAGFIDLSKQFCTIGINGMVEAAESVGIDPNNNPQYIKFISDRMKKIFDLNRLATEEYGCKFNTEFIPGENLGLKNSKWDKDDGLMVTRDIYNSYFYAVEDQDISILDKLAIHGAETTKYLDGGAAVHLNLTNHPDIKQCKALIDIAIQYGVPFWTTNVLETSCNNCGKTTPATFSACPVCGSNDVDYLTRIIGYTKKIKNFSAGRRAEAGRRFYHKKS